MVVLESFELSYYFLLRNRRLGGDYYSRNNHQQLDINIDTTAAEGGWVEAINSVKRIMGRD